MKDTQKIRWERTKTGKITGLIIFDKEEKTKDSLLDYCGSIEITTGDFLQIFTNKKYKFIEKKTAIKLLKALLYQLTK